ncbi:hypothetical protein OG975_05485 [Streptomyces sp. NBC_00203]
MTTAPAEGAHEFGETLTVGVTQGGVSAKGQAVDAVLDVPAQEYAFRAEGAAVEETQQARDMAVSRELPEQRLGVSQLRHRFLRPGQCGSAANSGRPCACSQAVMADRSNAAQSSSSLIATTSSTRRPMR